MLAFTWLSFGMGIPIAAASCWHISSYGVNALALALILFLHINALICLWELCLCYRHSLIRNVVAKREKEGGEISEPLILFRQASLSDVVSPSFWAYIWIDYCRYDPCYSEPGSLGYNIDVGNGHVTLIPSLFLLWSTVTPLAGPLVVGIMGIAMYWQTFYGTIIYAYSFINMGRYKKCTFKELVLCVTFPNMIWIVFPALGFWASCDIIFRNSMCILQEGCA